MDGFKTANPGDTESLTAEDGTHDWITDVPAYLVFMNLLVLF